MTAVKPGTWGNTRTQHGTLSGYQRHLDRGVPVCDACRTARRAYRRENYAQAPDQRVAAIARQRAFAVLARKHRREYHDLWRHEVAVLLARPPQPIGERAG